MSVFSRLAAIAAVVVLAACAREDLSKPQADIGNFRLGYNIVVAKNAQPVGPSRKAEPAEWEKAIKDEIARRTGTYQGDKLYHLATGVDAYALAVPGIPVLLAPKSALVITVNVWDDAAGVMINPEPKQFTIIEQLSDKSVVGSGLTMTREEQITGLAEQAARRINAWLVENKVWFTPEEVAKRAEGKAGRKLDAAAPAQAAGAQPAGAQPAGAKPAAAKAASATTGPAPVKPAPVQPVTAKPAN